MLTCRLSLKGFSTGIGGKPVRFAPLSHTSILQAGETQSHLRISPASQSLHPAQWPLRFLRATFPIVLLRQFLAATATQNFIPREDTLDLHKVTEILHECASFVGCELEEELRAQCAGAVSHQVHQEIPQLRSMILQPQNQQIPSSEFFFCYPHTDSSSGHAFCSSEVVESKMEFSAKFILPLLCDSR